MKTLLVIISDLHTNSTLGLCLPDGVILDDGGTYLPSTGQRYLYSYWIDFWERIKQVGADFAVENRTVVVNGDISDGDHHGSYQVISKHPSDMIRLAANILDPVRQWADIFYVVRGTSVHSGRGGYLEEEIAKDLDALPDSDGHYSRWHLYLSLDNVRFDIAHHGRMGSLPWTKANAANKLAFWAISEYNKAGELPPDVVVRSHRHFFAESGRNFATLGLFVPAWQAPTEYIHHIDPNTVPEFGGAWFIVENGKILAWDIIRYYLRRSRLWTYQ